MSVSGMLYTAFTPPTNLVTEMPHIYKAIAQRTVRQKSATADSAKHATNNYNKLPILETRSNLRIRKKAEHLNHIRNRFHVSIIMKRLTNLSTKPAETMKTSKKFAYITVKPKKQNRKYKIRRTQILKVIMNKKNGFERLF